MTLKLLQFESQLSAMKARKQSCGGVWLSFVFMLWWKQFVAPGDTVMVMIQFFLALNGYK